MCASCASVAARVTLLLLLLVALPSASSAAERYEVNFARTEGSPSHWVTLMARPIAAMGSATGHAFVTLGHEDPTTLSTQFASWGFMPVGESKSSFGALDGTLIDEWRKGSASAATVIVNVAVTAEDYAKASAVVDQWAKKAPPYHLLSASNCNDFTIAVAEAIGLTVTSDAKSFPVDVVRTIGRANVPVTR